MSYDRVLASLKNEKHRQGVLRMFIPSLNKSSCYILFSFRPFDPWTALSLAQEIQEKDFSQ